MIAASVKITKDVAEDDCFVLGSLGPLGVVLEPLGPTSREEAEDFYSQSVEALEKAGVDGFSLRVFTT